MEEKEPHPAVQVVIVGLVPLVIFGIYGGTGVLVGNEMAQRIAVVVIITTICVVSFLAMMQMFRVNQRRLAGLPAPIGKVTPQPKSPEGIRCERSRMPVMPESLGGPSDRIPPITTDEFLAATLGYSTPDGLFYADLCRHIKELRPA